MIEKTIYQQLKAARIAKKWSQQKLANQYSETPGTREYIARIESGKLQPNIATLQRLADILGFKIILKEK